MPPHAGSQAVPPPDGGWGWAIVLGAFISIGFSYAFPKATTVFFKDIQKIFDASYSQVAWISSIMLAVMYAGGKKKWGKVGGKNKSLSMHIFLFTRLYSCNELKPKTDGVSLSSNPMICSK